MDIKTILRKVFKRYAELGANSVSARGCYEPPVPNVDIKQPSYENNAHFRDTSE